MLFTAIISAVIVIALVIFLCMIYRVAPMNKALIITGGKEPVVKVSGGSFVIPIFRKASYFDLSMITVVADDDEIKTVTGVPIVINWTAQLRPKFEDVNALKKAVISFLNSGSNGIAADVKRTLAGCVLSTVSEMTPMDVMTNKEVFKKTVEQNVADELGEMGLKLISLNVGEITDRNGYYDAIAAKDNEEKRKEAEKVKAIATQEIREQTTESEKIARQRELDTELQIAAKKKDNDLQQAAFKAETDRANADAAIAGELQATLRAQELAEQEGKVQVVRWEQANEAAIREKSVTQTKAEGEKIRAEIEAAAAAAVAIKEAEAKAKVLEQEAAGKAKAVKTEAEAEANATRIKGETEADITRKQGIAEAEAIKAKKLAEAEGEKALAEARAANDQVNFELEKLQLITSAHIQIATEQAKVLADFGKNAQFVNVGNNASGNAFFDAVGQVPGLIKSLNVQNEALNGTGFTNEIGELVKAVAGPLKGMLSNDTTVINNSSEE